MTPPDRPKAQKLIYEGDLDPMRGVLGSLAVDKYCTHAWNEDNSEHFIHLWRINKTGAPSLLDSYSIGVFNITLRDENDQGGVCFYGSTMTSYKLGFVYLDGGSLAVNWTDCSAGYYWLFMSGDSQEMITVKPYSGTTWDPATIVEGWSTTGSGHWETSGHDFQGDYQCGTVVLGSPRAGTFLLYDWSRATTNRWTSGYGIPNTITGSNANGNSFDVKFSVTVPSPPDILTLASKRVSQVTVETPVWFAGYPFYTPPKPTSGGTLEWSGHVLDSDLGSNYISYYTPWHGYYNTGTAVWAVWSTQVGNLPTTWNYGMQDSGTFTMTFQTTASYTGGVTNQGWASWWPSYYPSPPNPPQYDHPVYTSVTLIYDYDIPSYHKYRLIASDGTEIGSDWNPTTYDPYGNDSGAYLTNAVNVDGDIFIWLSDGMFRLITCGEDSVTAEDFSYEGYMNLGSTVMLSSWKGQVTVSSFEYVSSGS